jgi:hypothetical protein
MRSDGVSFGTQALRRSFRMHAEYRLLELLRHAEPQE